MSDIAPGSRVELLPDRENVYRFARAGSTGIVVDEHEDEYGFQMVYVSWDPEVHEPDCWTFASHFKEIGSEGPSAEAMVRKAEDDRPRCASCGQVHDPEEDRIERHIDILMAGSEMASAAEGFALITMEQQLTDDGALVVSPQIYLSTLSPLGAAVIESQVAKLARMYHEERIDLALLDAIEEREDGRE